MNGCHVYDVHDKIKKEKKMKKKARGHFVENEDQGKRYQIARPSHVA